MPSPPQWSELYDPATQALRVTAIGGGVGGGGGPATIADGADVAEGATTDPDTAPTVIGRLKKLVALLTGTLTVSGPLTDAELRASAVPVSGAFFQATQPVSATALPLPAGAATVAKQDTAQTSLDAIKADVDKLPADPAREGGNLATLSAKDFATQATLALIKAKTDNLDVPLSGGGTHVVVDAMPAVSAQSSALVDDAVPSYTTGTTQPLSMSPTGRLRVVTESEALNLSAWGEPESFQTREAHITGRHPLSAW